MSAAEHLREAIDVGCTRDDHDHVADHRAEVLAEAKTEVVAWLAKKATEQPTWDAAILASKVDRGAVRIFLGTVHYMDARDAHRAEVLREAADVADHLTAQWPDMDAMKADGIIGPFSALGRLAAELRRMAAGKDTGGAPAGESTQPAPDFFQPGHTYADPNPAYDWQFRCDTVTVHPDTGERVALGWRRHRGEWEPYAYAEDDWELHLHVGTAVSPTDDPGDAYASTRSEPGGAA